MGDVRLLRPRHFLDGAPMKSLSGWRNISAPRALRLCTRSSSTTALRSSLKSARPSAEAPGFIDVATGNIVRVF
jgi:hypothetical protein